MKYDAQLKTQILELIELKPVNYGQCCASSTYKKLGEKIKKAVPKLESSNYSFKTRIFWILNDLHDFPECEICHKKVLRNVWTLKFGYRKNGKASITCSDECRKIAAKQAFEKTCLDKYGVTNVYAAECVKNKIKKTNFIKYGTENPGNRKEAREKAKQTLIKNYGKLGLASKEIKIKKIETSRLNYGVDFYAQSSAYKDQCRANVLKRFIEVVSKDPEIEFLDLEKVLPYLSSQKLHEDEFDFKCKKCGALFHGKLSFNNYYHHGTFSSCRNCHPHSASSFEEKELFEFVKSNYSGDVQTNKRTIVPGCELDVFIPEKKLAFEYDGVYWHSEELGTSKSYHLEKTLKCEKAGIRLIHIFETEWKNKKKIVKLKIRNLLGIHSRTIFARKCNVEEIDLDVSRKFQVDNQIQEISNSDLDFGLFFNYELVSTMSFKKLEIEDNAWEMTNFCCKLDFHILGAAGKLLKQFEKEIRPKSIISYVDRRWSTGKMQMALGFNMCGSEDPDFLYLIKNDLEPKTNWQGSILKTNLKTYNSLLSDEENMKNNGYKRIFDCGKIIFEKHLKQNTNGEQKQ